MTDLYGQCNHCGENLTAGHSCSGMLRNRAFFDAHSVKLRPSYDAIAAERDALAARLAEAERVIRAMHKLFDRDFAIVDRDITLRCESHDQAWNYLHEARDIVKSFLRPSDSAGAVQCDGGECGLGDYCEPCPKKEVKPDAWEESFLSSGVDPADGI